MFIRCCMEMLNSFHCVADPENSFQVQNWHLFLDFLVNFLAFFLISLFLDLSAVFLSKIS